MRPGVVSVLLPELERRGERPTLMVGTSVGGINTAFLLAISTSTLRPRSK